MGFPWLIAAADPVSIAFDRAVTLAWRVLVVAGGPWPDRGDEYSVTSAAIRPTASQLRDLGVITSPDPSLLALPAGIPTTVTDFARSWTAGRPTSFDQVVAIEQHLRSAPFIYDETVAYPSDPGVLADILTTTHRGFCQQFASLMAVMLREIGIPARVALGFTQGTKDGQHVDRDGRGPAHLGRGAVPRIRLALVRPHARRRVPRPIGDVRCACRPGIRAGLHGIVGMWFELDGDGHAHTDACADTDADIDRDARTTAITAGRPIWVVRRRRLVDGIPLRPGRAHRALAGRACHRRPRRTQRPSPTTTTDGRRPTGIDTRHLRSLRRTRSRARVGPTAGRDR